VSGAADSRCQMITEFCVCETDCELGSKTEEGHLFIVVTLLGILVNGGQKAISLLLLLCWEFL
jgi:hypothetical protein